MIDSYEGITDVVEDNRNDRSRFVGCLLRLAGHDFMDFRNDDENMGGADGCVSFEDADNKGLDTCLVQFDIASILKQHEDDISVADFIVVAAQAAMARAADSWDAEDPYKEGTLANKFMRAFKFGRQTLEECSWNVGRMPNPERGCRGNGEGDGLEQIFVDHIYADYHHPWTLVAAISGAHTVGKASVENSGYEGHWSKSK